MRARFSVILVLLAAMAGGMAAEESPGNAPSPPVHADPAQVETALLETLRAFLVEDTAAARVQLDRIEELSRRLGFDDEESRGIELVRYDQAFHLTLDRVRSLSGRGEMDEAFDQFIYVQRACVACHRIAREAATPD
jgi:hypothetical protein